MRNSLRQRGAATRFAPALLVALLVLTSAAPATRARVQTGVPASRLARLRRGVNLSHWFSQSRDYSVAHLRGHTTRRDIELIKSLGFDHVRFPFEPAPLFNEARPSELNAEYLRHLDEALDMLAASGLAVVLDLHPTDEFKIRLRTDDRAVNALADFWRSLARHVAARDPERLFLEIMNEPMAEDPFRWMGIQARVAAAIREGAPRHTIVATGPRWSSVDQLLLIEPVADRNVIYNFHFYEPHNFTHQGATWGADFWPHLKNIPYPSSPELVAPLLTSISNETARGALREYGEERWDASRVEREIARAAGWARARGVALTCNEFGVYRAYTPPASRLRWIADVRAAFERHRIGWTMWDYAGGFGVAVRKQGRAELDPDTATALGMKQRYRSLTLPVLNNNLRRESPLSRKVSRRTFAKVAGAAALASAVNPSALGDTAATEPCITLPQGGGAQGDALRSFPPGFLWGTATASYQVEGAVKEDGRGPSIWDTFSHTPGKTVNNATGDVADDHYHRYKDDVQLMKSLGVKGYRFSIAWPRVFPNGDGPANPKGLDFYNRLVDELLANGIQPYATLYHWDLPQSLQDRFGGWEGRDTSKAFADYAGYVTARLTDRVKHIFTINEFGAFIEVGYRWGVHAPGLRLTGLRLNQTRHHAVLGHGLAVQAIRASAKPGTKVGIAENITVAAPVFESPAHIAAAERATREMNAQYLTVIQEGKYTDWYLKSAGADAPKFTAEDLKAISSPLDFVGINIYTPQFVRAADSEPGFVHVPHPPSFPHAPSPWLFVGPEALYWGPRHVSKLWGAKEIYITENGCSSSDVPAADGKVYDTDRVTYLRSYLTQLRRATAEGVPVRGYFLWSLMDNFEWADGYTNRFGLHYVDYDTQKRTPKLSADFYREVIARNAVV